MELLENKDKIKPELVNREYDPDDAESIVSFYSARNDKAISNLDVRLPKLSEDNDESENNESDKEDNDNFLEDNNSNSDNNDDDYNDGDNENDYQDNNNDLSSFIKDDISLSNSSGSRSNHSEKRDDLHFDENETQFNDDDEVYSHKSFVSEKNDTRDKLKELLKNEVKRPSPPRLSDLEHAGMLKQIALFQTLNISENIEEEDEEDKKRELLFKFELLEKSYKNVNIPDFSIHSSLKKMNETYENQLRHLSLDSSVESFKIFL